MVLPFMYTYLRIMCITKYFMGTPLVAAFHEMKHAIREKE